jgi:hypothetical protein
MKRTRKLRRKESTGGIPITAFLLCLGSLGFGEVGAGQNGLPKLAETAIITSC